MVFDWTLNVGNLLTFAGGIVTLVALYYAMRMDVTLTAEKLSVLGGRMINLETEIKKLTEVTATLAIQSHRMTALESHMAEQSHRMNMMQQTISDWKLETFKRNHDE